MSLIEGILQDLPAPAGNVNKPALRAYIAAREVISVKDDDYGAVGNKTADDLAAFNSALAAAYTAGAALFIPPVAPGDYYKLSGAWVITDRDSISIFGAGTSSLLVIANAAGANCITLNSTTHATIRDIGIYGTSGSGHGIELTNASHYNKFRGIWIGWCDGDGIRVTSGQSNIFTDIDIDQNNGYRPATLSGLSDGSIDRGVYVPYDASGNTNNQSFVNCRINAAGATVSLQVGDSSGSVDSFSWVGGLIQGSSVYKEVYFRTRDGSIVGAHIEPPVGATANYVVDFDRCSNTFIEGGSLQGDVILRGACIQTGLRNVRGCGVDISATSEQCFVRDGQYGNITTGPTGGQIIDRSNMADIRNMKNASNERFHFGRNVSPQATVYFATNMQDWLGGGSPTNPAGLSHVGAGTLTRDTSVLLSGSTYSAKHVRSADTGQYLNMTLTPLTLPIGKYVTVEAWVYNLTTATATINMLEGGTGASASQASRLADSWERVIVSFKPNASATSVTLQFGGSTGTSYWGRIKILLDDFVPLMETTLTNAATPDATVGGRMVPNLLTGGTTTITNFPDAHPGVPFTVMARHSITVLGVALTSGQTATFKRAADTGSIYQV